MLRQLRFFFNMDANTWLGGPAETPEVRVAPFPLQAPAACMRVAHGCPLAFGQGQGCLPSTQVIR